ncbi:ribosome hibernation factor-recruiting GTPase MRF [Rhodococcus gannanensis]|uniref:Ribosome hibernation factor-recruiting GTPase MRF n=1 Tax=Rhodococcus gannanensis TaxID=1960308 RepID=A0ABW4NYR6_9NOCA
MTDRRTPVVLVTGWMHTEVVAATFREPGTVVVHHDLDHLREGVVRRTVTDHDGRADLAVLELAHGCVNCTLREDLLPLLRRLHGRSSVQRIVLHLDRIIEPESVCRAVETVDVTGLVGQVDGPASRDVRVEAIIACVDAATWLDDATGEEDLGDRGVAVTADDERTVAQVVVGQVDLADVIVVAGRGVDGWSQARLHAVLTRLAPTAPIDWIGDDLAPDGQRVLDQVPADARRGAPLDAHAPLLRGEPSLATDCGVTLVEFAADRPFHPERLHDAVDVLFEGVVTARGRMWLATQPDNVLWLESAGGGLRVGKAGRWLAAMTPEEQEGESATRRALAALRWDEREGDRHTSLVALACGADPTEIDRALQWALVTDDELADTASWANWDDPFADWHEDPCGDQDPTAAFTDATDNTREDRA